MENNSSNNTWTVNFILNANGLGGGDAVVTRTENDVYEVEVFGDLVADADTIEEAFALAEDMVSFTDAVNAVTVEVEEEIVVLENELDAVEKISHLLSLVSTTNLVGFLCDEIDEQLELLEALENYTYDMFVEDRWDAEEEAVIEMIDEAIAEEEEEEEEEWDAAEWDAAIDAFIDEILEEEAVEEEVNGNVRGPFSVI
jgi:hypothetical protein